MNTVNFQNTLKLCLLFLRVPDTKSQFNALTNVAVFQEEFKTCTKAAQSQPEKLAELTRAYKRFQDVGEGTNDTRELFVMGTCS